MQLLEHRILGMWKIDQHCLVSRGWPCGDSYTKSSDLKTFRAGPISRQILVLSEHNLFT